MGDYAASSGTSGFDDTVVFPSGATLRQDGAFQAVKGLRFADLTDGLSNTLLVGEKHVPPGMVGLPPWDCGMWDGHNIACSTRAAGPAFPMAAARDDFGWKFGSRHPGICQFVFADGSVRAVAKTIDPVTLGLLAQRNDGQPIPDF